MLSAYVEVLLCVIELLAFVAFKNTTLPFKEEISACSVKISVGIAEGK